MTYGFLGLRPGADHLAMTPRLPEDCPRMGMTNLWYGGVRMAVEATADRVRIAVRERPANAIRLRLGDGWKRKGTDQTGPGFTLDAAGTYTFVK